MVISSEAVPCSELIQRFPQFFVDSIGDLGVSIRAVSAPESAEAGSLVFLATPKAFTAALSSTASAYVVSPKMKSQAEAKFAGKTVLIANNVERAMATVVSEYFLRTPYTNKGIQGVHPSAIVHSSAQLGTDVRIGPNAFIGAGVRLGSRVYIGANSVIEDDSEVGDDTVIHPLVFIGHSTQIGKRCEIHPQTVVGKEGFGYAHDERGNHYRIPHQGRVVLEDGVHLGSSCTIDRGTFGETRIEAGAILDNQIHIAHNCEIGKNAICTAGFAMAGSSRVGANFLTGGGSVVTGHVVVCDNVQLAGLSAISKDVTKPGQYGGFPLMPLKQYMKSRATIAKLPEMRKQLTQIMNKLGLSEEHEPEAAE